VKRYGFLALLLGFSLRLVAADLAGAEDVYIDINCDLNERIESSLSNNTLRKLTFEAVARDLKEPVTMMLGELIKNTSTLRELYLIFPPNFSLGNHVEIPEQAKVIFTSLEKNHTVETLAIAHNVGWIGADGTNALVSLLTSNQTLKAIDVSLGKTPTSQDYARLADAIKSNKVLTHIGLTFENITQRDAESFVKFLSQNQTLTRITLNYCGGDAQIPKILQKGQRNPA